ncbi:MAG: DUF1499 domain-containing protein [Bacillaceae bacterium]|nr:DUF1499 domain-containing protein [Bacillaceae bacterium]
MGIKSALKKLISTHTETNEKHPDELLQTRYYKAMREKTFNELIDLLKQLKQFDVTSSAIERGEIIVKGHGKKQSFIVITVIMVSPNRTAVDFSVTTETRLPTDFGYSSNVIKQLYKKIDERLEYVGSGLGDQLIRK